MAHTINQSKTIELIAQLLPKEINRFRHFISSSDSFKDPVILKAFDLMHKANDEGRTAEMTKEELFKKVYGRQKYDDVKLRHLLSKLNKAILDFWAWVEYEKQPVQYALNLGNQLLQRNLYIEYDRQLAQHLSRLKHTPQAHPEYHLALFQLEFQELESTTTIARRRLPGKIEGILQRLDTYYMIKKLQLCCELVNMQNMMAASDNVLLFNEIMEYVEKNKAILPVTGMVYYYIINMLKYPENTAHYDLLIKTLHAEEANFPAKELRELYHYALNYCIKQINLGNIVFQREILHTYKRMLRQNMLHIGRHIPEHNFKNIVTVALREHETEWTLQFIDEHIKQVAPESRHNAYHYNIANYYFSGREYKQALLHLQKVQFNDPYYALDTRCMMMKIYFELGEEQVLDSHISAFRVFLHRSKTISDFQRTIYKNLVNYTSRMMHAAQNERKLKTLKTQIENAKQVADLRWLKEKAGELVKK
jgi:DNA-binding winged helix-turn-helix (wHTH) protein